MNYEIVALYSDGIPAIACVLAGRRRGIVTSAPLLEIYLSYKIASCIEVTPSNVRSTYLETNKIGMNSVQILGQSIETLQYSADLLLQFLILRFK